MSGSLQEAWYLYLDETGNLDLDFQTKKGATSLFGISSALFRGNHGDELWEGAQLRFELESEGVSLPTGFHAKDDRPATRWRVINLIEKHGPRLDVTLLHKQYALPKVREKVVDTGGIYLYQLAWFLHFKFLCRYVLPKNARIFVIGGTLGSPKQAKAARAALHEVCEQVGDGRDFVLCRWDTSTSWALQVADYAAWSAFRRVARGACEYYDRLHPLFRSVFTPWELDIKQRTAIPAPLRIGKGAPGSLVAVRSSSSMRARYHTVNYTQDPRAGGR